MRLLLKNAWVLTMDEAFTAYPNGWLLTDGSRIAAVGDGNPPGQADEVIDCAGAILLPGFVNTHCHAAMVPFRSMGDDCPDRLRRFLFPLENEAMTPALVSAASRYGIAEMLLSGTTTFVDMYYFEEEVARAAAEMGVRVYAGETVISQKAPDAACPAESLQRCERLLRDFAGDDRVHPMVAPHGTTTVDEETLRAAHALASRYDSMLTLHACEMDDEMRFFARQGITPIAYLDRLGLCDPHLIAAHCIHMQPEDLLLIRDRGVRVAHCIGSNTKAGKGVAPAAEFVRHGIAFGLGTDGPASGNTLSMFDQMRLFAAAHKTANHNRALFPAQEIVALATRGGAQALHAADYGMLRAGYRADVTVVSTDSPAMYPVFNPYSALVYAANASDVRHVLVNGYPAVRDYRLTGFSLPALRAEVDALMPAFAKAAAQYKAYV